MRGSRMDAADHEPALAVALGMGPEEDPQPNEQVGEARNPVPVIATFPKVIPCLALFGLTAVTVGAGFTKGVTVKELTAVPVFPSGFVMAILRSPRVVLAASVMFAVICVAELKVQLLIVILAPKLQVAPDRNPVPAMTTPERDAPCAPVFGVAEVGAGGGNGALWTEKPFTRLPLWASTLVTVTVRTPTAAPALMVIEAVIDVPELNVQLLTVMPAPKLHSGESKKPVPLIAILKVAP